MDINEVIIEEVKKYECLYDLSSNSYKNVYKKEEIWESIAETVSLTSEICKKRWKGLRDTYKKRKRIAQLSSGSGAPTPAKPWKYFSAMSFLDNYRDSRQTVGNVNTAESEFGVILDCFSPTTTPESVVTPSIVESENFVSEPLPKKPCKKRADAEVTEVFTEMMKECVGTIQELAAGSHSNESGRDATSLLFESLAKKISDSHIPQANVRRIESKVIALVYDELSKTSDLV